MVKKIVHMADVHIKNYQRLGEFDAAVATLIPMLNEEFKGMVYEERLIVIAGDTVHQKNTISNELIAFVADFFCKLEEVAPVLVISGNHDLIVGNDSRMDTLTSIFKTAKFKDVHFVDMELGYKSGVYEWQNISFVLYSIWQDYAEPDLSSLPFDTAVLGLFHGPIVGSKLANGTNIESGHDISMFEHVSAVLAGDIHKQQTIEYNGGKLVYPGSLIQQDMGESVNGHGYVVWECGKRKLPFPNTGYDVTKCVELPTDYGMYKVKISSLDDFDNDKEEFVNIN